MAKSSPKDNSLRELRARAEEDLKLRALFLDASYDAILLRKTDGGIIYANEAASQLYSYSREELTHMYLRDLVPPENVTVFERNQEIIREKGSFQLETQQVKKNGSRITVETRATLVKSESGDYIMSVTRDITARKQAEEALKASEEKFRNLVENAPVGIAIVTLDGRPLIRNRAIIEQSGYSAEELGKMTVLDRYYNPDDRKIFLELAKKGFVRNFETRSKRKDGSFYWASLTSIPQKTELGDSLITIIEDITERKLAERKLRESEEKYRRIVETANEGIWISEPNGRITFINQQMADFLSYAREEMLGHNRSEFLKKGQEETVARLNEELARGISSRLEFEFRRKDGATVWTLTNITPLFDITGKHTGNLAMHTDITDRKRDEAELKQLPLKLIQAQENERRAIGRELHDQTGQYLTALKLLTARAKTLPPDKVGKALNETYDLIGELMQQVKELSLRMRPPMIDELGLMASLIWQVDRVKQMGVSVNFRHTGINKKKLPMDVSIAAFRIVQEALTNAARHAGVDCVDVTVRATRSRLYIKVQDKGKGFDMENLVAGGSGGLSSMRERALMLGGTLTVDSHQGMGTVVSAEIPIPQRDG
jgi:PAS domain S-box-containing protein